jgi:hypothetical protein
VVSPFKVNQSNGRISGVICHPAIKNDSSAILDFLKEFQIGTDDA